VGVMNSIFNHLDFAELPGLNGFVGEFLILAGSFVIYPTSVIIAASGIILSAVYLLWMVERVFFGQLKSENKHLNDLMKGSERW